MIELIIINVYFKKDIIFYLVNFEYCLLYKVKKCDVCGFFLRVNEIFFFPLPFLGQISECSLCHWNSKENGCQGLCFARRYCRGETENGDDHLCLPDGQRLQSEWTKFDKHT